MTRARGPGPQDPQDWLSAFKVNVFTCTASLLRVRGELGGSPPWKELVLTREAVW